MTAPTTDSRRERISAWTCATLAVGAFGWYAGAAPHNAIPLALGLVALVPVFALADPVLRIRIRALLPPDWRGGFVVWALVFALVVVAAWLEQELSLPFALRWAASVALPLVVLGPGRQSPSALRLLGAAVGLALPYATGFAPSVWIALAGRAPVNFAYPVLLDLGFAMMLVYRPVENLGYRLWLGWREVALAIIAFAGFAIVAVPVGFALRFLALGHGVRSVTEAGAMLFTIYFATAIPEELLFRGMVQNSLARLIGGAGLPVAALLFGVAHVGNPPVPNWRYGLLAAVAGLAYGWVYQRTRSITVSAVTHALVDWTWLVWLAGLRL